MWDARMGSYCETCEIGKPDRLVTFMSINCLNLSSVNGEILIETKEKKKRTGETLCQYVTIQ